MILANWCVVGTSISTAVKLRRVGRVQGPARGRCSGGAVRQQCRVTWGAAATRLRSGDGQVVVASLLDRQRIALENCPLVDQACRAHGTGAHTALGVILVRVPALVVQPTKSSQEGEVR